MAGPISQGGMTNPTPPPFDPVVGYVRYAIITDGGIGPFSEVMDWDAIDFANLFASRAIEGYGFVSAERTREVYSQEDIISYLQWLGCGQEFEPLGGGDLGEFDLAETILARAYGAKHNTVPRQAVVQFNQPGLAMAKLTVVPFTEENIPSLIIELYSTYAVPLVQALVRFAVMIPMMDNTPPLFYQMVLPEDQRNRLCLIAAAIVRDFWVSDMSGYDFHIKSPQKRRGKGKARKRRTRQTLTYLPRFSLDFEKPTTDLGEVLSLLTDSSQSALELLFG